MWTWKDYFLDLLQRLREIQAMSVEFSLISFDTWID